MIRKIWGAAFLFLKGASFVKELFYVKAAFPSEGVAFVKVAFPFEEALFVKAGFYPPGFFFWTDTNM